MAFWLDLDNGSDSNDGLTAATPKKTIAAGLALFDTSSFQYLYVRGTGRNEWFSLSGKSNKVIQRWPEAAKPNLTHRLVTGNWVTSDNLVFATTIATGLSIDAVTFGWGQYVNPATGGHGGFCKRLASAAAVSSAATGNLGRYHYDSSTGVLTAYFGGANPNSAGREVGYSTVATAEAAFRLVGCTNILISGFKVGPMPKYSGQYGWAVRAEGSTGCIVEGVEAYDMGAHVFGTLGGSGDSSGLVVRGCVAVGLSPVGTHMVSHQNQADGAYSTPPKYENCTIVATRYRGLDDEVLDGRSDTVAAMDANTQICAYGHSDGGTGIKFDLVNCTILNYDSGSARPWAIGDSAAVAIKNLNNGDLYPARIIGGSVTNFAPSNVNVYPGHWSVRRVAFSTNVAPSTGFSAIGIFFGIAAVDNANYHYLFEACTFSGSLDGGGATRMFSGQGSTGGTKRFSFVGCSFNNTGVSATQFCGIFDAVANNVKYFECRGGIISHKTASPDNCVILWDTATALNDAFTDNLYFNVGNANSRYAHIGAGAGYNAAQWFANVDTSGSVAGNVLAADPYAATTLEPTATAKAKTRATSTPAQSLGINGRRFDSKFGAFQYGPNPQLIARQSALLLSLDD